MIRPAAGSSTAITPSLRVELHPLSSEIRFGGGLAGRAAPPASRVHRLRLDVHEILIGQPAPGSREERVHGGGSRGEDDLPSQLPLPAC